MNHYIDIELLPDPELAPNHLLNALFARLHRALVTLGESVQIGISFPRVADAGKGKAVKGLGEVLRLHGEAASLANLSGGNWLAALRDHVRVSDVLAVPVNAQHRAVRRVQAKSNPERLRRRAMKRQGIDAAAALARIPESAAEMLDLPFLQLSSASTGQTFRFFIRHEPVTDTPVTGTFNAYGLSSAATVPWF